MTTTVAFLNGSQQRTPVSAAQPLPVQGASGGTPMTVQGDGITVAVTPVLSVAGAYADGNLLFDLTAVSSAVLAAGDECYVQSLTVIDKDAEGIAMDVYVSQGTTSLGTIRSAPNITDANIVANQLQRLCKIVTGDYDTVSAAKIATMGNLALPIKTGAGTSFSIGAIARSAATFTAADDIVLLVGIARK